MYVPMLIIIPAMFIHSLGIENDLFTPLFAISRVQPDGLAII